MAAVQVGISFVVVVIIIIVTVIVLLFIPSSTSHFLSIFRYLFTKVLKMALIVAMLEVLIIFSMFEVFETIKIYSMQDLQIIIKIKYLMSGVKDLIIIMVMTN
jgi:hypothetical protein